MPVFDTGQGLKQKIEDELERMNISDILDAASRTKMACERCTIWENAWNGREATEC
jgi:hypothetical protein